MYQRLLEPPDHSFFLFGPRSTGKSTWLGQALPGAYRFDLLDTALYLELSRRPAYFTEVVEALDPRTWVVVDEVQRIPTLLNHIHALIAKHGNRHRFALSGSNARKLRRLDANLLAGRVFTRNMFPLVTGELGADGGAARRLEYGSLPKVAAEPAHAVDILRAYVLTYLQQEIQQEALVKDTGAFSRFLEVAALMNGQTVNVASLARDSGVARPTVQRYFEVLIDTLVGTWVRAWQPKARIKETAHPRFYFFDPGVIRAVAGRLEEPLDSAEKGPLFETLVLHELRAADSYRNLGGRISYWRTPSGSEVDFVWSRGRRHVGFEVKSATAWRPEWSRTLNELIDAGILEAAYGVYLGTDRLVQGSVRILPFDDFATGLYARDLLVAPKS